MQEECAALGVPLLVLRERTDAARIAAAVQAIAEPTTAAGEEPYGDGFAGERIAAHVADWLESGSYAVPEHTPSDQPEPIPVSAAAARRSS
jgi:UDP-N-acetylglucosamine 2-epimerase